MKKEKVSHLLSSLLDMSPEEWVTMKRNVNEAQNKSIERELKILREFSSRYNTMNWAELFFGVVNEYTEFKIKESKGKKERWTPLLSAMIAVEINERRKGRTLKAAITELENHILWSEFINGSEDGYALFHKAYKDGRKTNNRHEYALAQRLYEGSNWELEIKGQIRQFQKL
jgi:hypothetical protein